jgi:hypothetical protein
MIQLEIQVVSDQREGLLIELGRVIHGNHYTVLRQRMAADQEGKTCLTLLVRGPAERQMMLEEALATHARVRVFEAALQGGGEAVAAAQLPKAAVSHAATSSVYAFDRSRSGTHAATSSAPASAPTSPTAAADARAVEAVLPQIARDYPKFFPWLLELQRTVAPEARQASLHQAGRRTGAWVYKRDFALGAKLNLHDAIRRIALPALRTLTSADMQGDYLRLPNHPLAPSGGQSGCRFLCGYLEGLLGESVSNQAVFVRETFCRSSGADACTFEISH